MYQSCIPRRRMQSVESLRIFEHHELLPSVGKSSCSCMASVTSPPSLVTRSRVRSATESTYEQGKLNFHAKCKVHQVTHSAVWILTLGDTCVQLSTDAYMSRYRVHQLRIHLDRSLVRPPISYSFCNSTIQSIQLGKFTFESDATGTGWRNRDSDRSQRLLI